MIQPEVNIQPVRRSLLFFVQVIACQDLKEQIYPYRNTKLIPVKNKNSRGVLSVVQTSCIFMYWQVAGHKAKILGNGTVFFGSAPGI